jgi:hypothetical protein
MPEARVEVKGAAQASAVLRGIADGCEELAPPEAGRILVAAARARAPRKTGRLASSINSTVRGRELRVGTPVSYGWPVHSGVPARGIPGRPFLFQAAQAAEPAVAAAYAKDLDKLVTVQAATKGYHA